MSITRIRLVLGVVLVVALLAPVPPALAGTIRSGEPDRSFGDRGTQVIDLPGADRPIGLVALPGGRVAVLIVSDIARPAVVALGRDGRPVPTFGLRGVATLPLSADAAPVGLAVDGSGRMYVAATDVSSGSLPEARAVVIRLTSHGTPDRTYGRNGVATTPLGEATPTDTMPVAFGVARGGDVVVAGMVAAGGYYAAAGTAALVRFRPDGRIDDRFGVGGVVPLGNRDLIPIIGGVSLDPAGRVVVAEEGFVTSLAADEIVVRRFTTTGRPDLDFGVAGAARVAVGGLDRTAGADESVRGLVHDAKGRILVFGDTWNRWVLDGNSSPGDIWPPYVARLRADGSMDPSFGSGGAAVVRRDARRRGLLWSGGLAVAGEAVYFTALFDHSFTLRHSVVGLDPAGRLDRRFAPAGPALDNVSEIAVSGQRVVVAGTKGWREGGTVVAAYRR